MNDAQNFETRILRYSDLCSIPIVNTDDPLIDMRSVDNVLPVDFSHAPYPMVRQEVWRRLIQAAKELRAIDQHYMLKIWYAYRPLSIQTKWFNEQCARLRKTFPLISELELSEKAHVFTAVPEVAGHPTGAALDLTISKNHKELDMGCAYLDFQSDRLASFSDGLTDNQKKNRMLLRKVMMNNEFAPFNGEWWHFSYGDKEWAAFWGKPYALFDFVEVTSTGLTN